MSERNNRSADKTIGVDRRWEYDLNLQGFLFFFCYFDTLELGKRIGAFKKFIR